MSAKKTRWILISGALVLFVLLFISPRQKTNAASDAESGTAAVAKPIARSNKQALEVYLNLALNNLTT